MRICVRDHQGKSHGLQRAIAALGHELVSENADLLLIDHDCTPWYHQVIEAHVKQGAKVWLYPHGATAFLAYDGIWEQHPAVSGYLAMSKGMAEVMRRYGYQKPVYVSGWHWSAIKPFRPTIGVRRVLFAPLHPLSNGYMRPENKAANFWAHQALDMLPDIVDVRVRHIGEVEQNGLFENSKFDYVNAAMTNQSAADDIEWADVVISVGTFAYLAIAAGKPTICYAQEASWADGHSSSDIRKPKSVKKYADYLAYPIDYQPGRQDLWTMVRYAAEKDIEARLWKEHFIGSQMQGEHLNELLEAMVNA